VRSRKSVISMSVETPAEQAVAQGLVSAMDLLRLKAIARLHAWGLPADMGWADLLQEALLRLLQGSRKPPPGIPTVTFVAGIMRSIKDEQWRRQRRAAPVAAIDIATEAIGDPAPDPERCLAARQELAAIYQLFADDPAALQILHGLGAGLTPEEIRTAHALSKTEYDSTRKRMRRALLRKHLTWRLR
jgi:DNA-directed RNA polymerase specialized sigma24 family protein